MTHIYLTCIHNRHTDDKFKAFHSEQEAKDYLLKMNWSGVEPSTAYYGDWCLYLSDDYYMFVQKIELQ